jgi:hypothetical protein
MAVAQRTGEDVRLKQTMQATIILNTKAAKGEEEGEPVVAFLFMLSGPLTAHSGLSSRGPEKTETAERAAEANNTYHPLER